MKLLIASDIHGSAYWCSKLMDAYQNEKADRMILLGDILYHGPRNALPKEYDPQRVCDLLNQISDRILCVRGNCDADVDQWLIHFPIMADYSWIMEKDRVIYLTHGHVYGKDFRKDESFPPLQKKDVVLSGHTHIPITEPTDGGLFFNPGSVSIPKNGSKNGYMVLRLTQIWKLFIRISHSELMTKTIVLKMSLMQVCGFSHSLKVMAMRFLHMILLILTLQEPTILSQSQVSPTRQS